MNMSQQLIPQNEIPADVRQAKQRLGIVGNSPLLQVAIARAIRVAPIDLSVLVIGESGSGKEFFPQIIHGYSPRKHSKYIAVNCGAIPEGTIDSELFGHEKGSFTGAVASRKGYFEEADGGTIFLDEVAELPLTTQARLLRVLETGEFLKVGSSTVQKTNIRIVAATNVDLVKAVAEGRFRQDLYYRLSTVQINIPPLRERGDDIMLLARKFASDFAERYRTAPVSFADSGRVAMMHYSWPGNVRQLKNVVEQIALFESGTAVDSEAVGRYLPANATVYTPTLSTASRSKSYDSEREVIFNMIFRLQKQIEELKSRLSDKPHKLVEAFVKVDSHMPSDDEETTDVAPVDVMPTDLVNIKNEPVLPSLGNPAPAAGPRSLEDEERQAIAAALERNSGRRKIAAQELGISERTLYRKIKEYGLD